MRRPRTSEKQVGQTVPRVTPDFNAMISIVSWNSAGFFFTEFLIPYAGITLGGNGLGIGIMFSFIVLGGAISSLIVGYLADKMRKTTLILIGAVGRGISYLVMYMGILAGSLAIISSGTFILGLLVSFYWVPFDTLVSNKSHKDNRSYAFGKRHAAMGRGQLVGGSIGVTVFILASELAPGIDALLFSPMLIYFASNLVGGLQFKRKVDERLNYSAYIAGLNDQAITSTPQDVSEETGLHLKVSETVVQYEVPVRPRKKHDSTKGLILGLTLLLGSYFLSSMNGMIAKPFMQIYLLQVITSNPTFVLLAYAPAGIMSMLASPKLGILADRMNPYIGITIFSVLGALSTFIIINVNNIFLFSGILIADMVLGNASSLVLSNIFSRISIKHRGKVIGAGSAANNLGGALGPILGGALVDSQGIVSPFITSIFIEISLIVPFLLAIKRLKPYFAESLVDRRKKG